VKRYSGAELVAFLRRVDARLTKTEVLEVIGGAAAVLKYGASAPTKDIDTWNPVPKAVQDAADAVGAMGQGVPLAPAGVAEIPNDVELRFKTVSIGLKKLVVRVPDRYDLALSKTIRGYDNDLQVIKECTRRSRFRSKSSSPSSRPSWTAWSRKIGAHCASMSPCSSPPSLAMPRARRSLCAGAWPCRKSRRAEAQRAGTGKSGGEQLTDWMSIGQDHALPSLSPRPIGPRVVGAMRLLLWPVASVLSAGIALAATPPPEVTKIDERCALAAKLDDRHKTGLRILADLSDAVRPEANDGRGKWVPFRSAEDLKRYARKNSAPNTQAQTWSARDGTFIASLYFQSDSGDWSNYVDYCFRVDGTLARSEAIVVNNSAEIDGRRVVYYAADGHVLFSTARSSDERGKPRADLDGLDLPPVYPTVKSLPFNAPVETTPPAPAPLAGVSAGTVSHPAMDGILDSAAVANQVRSRVGGVRHCYDQELVKNRTLAGKVVVHWTIDLAGTTRDVSVESAAPPMGQVAACVVELVKRWRFVPEPKDTTVEISFPFVFQSADGQGTRTSPPSVSDSPARK
jgi:TonB family protein